MMTPHRLNDKARELVDAGIYCSMAEARRRVLSASKKEAPQPADQMQFIDEFAAADGYIVIANGKLTADAAKSPTVRALFKHARS